MMNKDVRKKEDNIIAEYEKKSQDILFRMYQVLQKAENKIANEKYRKILQDNT